MRSTPGVIGRSHSSPPGRRQRRNCPTASGSFGPPGGQITARFAQLQSLAKALPRRDLARSTKPMDLRPHQTTPTTRCGLAGVWPSPLVRANLFAPVFHSTLAAGPHVAAAPMIVPLQRGAYARRDIRSGFGGNS